jgi:hypothetical protein
VGPSGVSKASTEGASPRAATSVKLAAPSDLQPESQAAHVTAKATSALSQSGDHAADLGGVWSAARGQRVERNARGPSVQPGSGQRGSYKPPAKSSAAQRESEGIVVASSRAPTSRHPERHWRPTTLKDPDGRDRVVQMAATLVLEPIFEADFLP